MGFKGIIHTAKWRVTFLGVHVCAWECLRSGSTHSRQPGEEGPEWGLGVGDYGSTWYRKPGGGVVTRDPEKRAGRQNSPGDLRWGGSTGPPLLEGFSDASIPKRFFPGPQHTVGKGRAGRGRHIPSEQQGLPSPPGGSAAPGAGYRRSSASPSPVLPAGGPDPHSSQASRSGGTPGNLCAPQGAAQGSRTWAPVPVPEASPEGPRSQVRLPVLPTVLAPGPGEVAPGKKASLSSFPSRLAVSPGSIFRSPFAGRGWSWGR